MRCAPIHTLCCALIHAHVQANPTVTFSTTLGDITCTLFLKEMPITVSNFIDLVNSGFYNGLHFHRVMYAIALSSRLRPAPLTVRNLATPVAARTSWTSLGAPSPETPRRATRAPAALPTARTRTL